MQPLRPTFGLERLESRVLLAAQVVISEFMAKNKITLKDDTGLYSDWVELHNAGDTAADLGGWGLNDSKEAATQWTFPAGASLAAGGYMVVWASGLDHKTPGQPFHTNFKLDDAGEYLALVRPDGVAQQQFAPTFPPQSADVSYGLSDDNDPTSPLVYFATPSPGAHNVPNAAAVTFSLAGGAYTAAQSVTLASVTPNAQIRYTTNGSVPTATSTLYTGPLTVSRDTMLRARAFGPGLLPSPVTGQQYFVLDASTAAFHSNLPLVVLDSGGSAIAENSQTAVSAMVLAAPAGGEAMLTQAPEYIGRAGLNVRGQTSTSFPKKQYHLELWDQSNADEKHSLLGMPSEADWVLYAPYSEKSLMQNQLAYQWANEAGEYAVRTRWVEVFLNTSGQATVSYARDYVGVYLLMEKIEVGADRVDIAKLEPGQDAAPEVTGGYLWHKDKTDPEDTAKFTTGRGQTFLYEDPTSVELDAAQKAYLTGYVNQFESALYGGNFADPAQGYAKYINVRSFVDNWILVEMAKNIDGFRLSTYYYKDRNGLITMGPVWDYNLSMGNANYNGGDSATGWYHDKITAQEYTYFDRLTQDPNFMVAIAARWKELRGTVFSTANLMADVDANVAVLTAGNGNYPVGNNPPQAPNNPVVRNFQKWNILNTNVWPNAYVGNSWLNEVNRVKTFLSTRVSWMDGQLSSLVPASAPGTPSALAASPVSGVQVSLAWVLADANATAVQVERSEDGGVTWKPQATLAGSASSYVANGLSPGTAYSFRVRATNTLGTSAYSNVASATTTFQVPTLNFPDFNNAGDTLTFNGSASVNAGAAQLTPNAATQVGAVWSVAQQDVRKFTTSFSFVFAGGAVADGMTFTVQRSSGTALGGGGGSLGYEGIGNSLAIKFDLYPDVSTTGLYANGASPGEDANAVGVAGVNFHAGHTYACTLTYNGSSLAQTVTDTSTGVTFTKTYAGVNLPATIGGTTAWVGFTAATGGATADMRVLDWTFATIPSDPPVVKSTTVAGGAAQRSQVKQLTVAFDQPVTLAAGAARLFRANAGGSGADDGSAPTDVSAALASPTSGDGGRTWVFTFLPGTFAETNGSLKDGVYTLTLTGAGVTGAGGAAMAANASVTFHRLFGDQDGNRTVNNADYVRFRSAFGSAAGDAAFDPAFDVDGNGVVNNADYVQFRARFGRGFTY